MDNRNGGSDGSCHYSVLGIRREASLSDVRAAYRRLALKWHPDRLTTKDPSLEEGYANRRFQRIQEAYSVLSDEGKRSMYDAGTLHLFDEDDDDDEGMGEFMHDLLKMMDNNNSRGGGGEARKEESLEDLQRCFIETFGASYLTVQHPKTTSTTTTTNDNTTSSRSSYARPPPKTYRKTNRRTNSSSTSTTTTASSSCC